jgi:ribonucleoside-diphosphate reductase alpha chain
MFKLMNARLHSVQTVSQPRISPNAHRVLEARYLRRDAQRRVIETPEQLFARVADAVAAAERLMSNEAGFSFWRDAFHRMLTSLEFPPNSPTLMNAGYDG